MVRELKREDEPIVGDSFSLLGKFANLRRAFSEGGFLQLGIRRNGLEQVTSWREGVDFRLVEFIARKENQRFTLPSFPQGLHQGMNFWAKFLVLAFCSLPFLVLGEEAKKGPNQALELGSVCVFMDTGCPIARYHTRTLRILHEEYSNKGIRFTAVFPAANTTQETIEAYAKKYKFPLKVVLDPGQTRARTLKATIVPEVFVFDRKQKLIYRGRIDDHFAAVGKRRPLTRTHDLADVLRALIAGEQLKTRQTKPIGCAITFRKIKNPHE